jgi:hypothetical protein
MSDDDDLECDSCDRTAMSVMPCVCGCGGTWCPMCWLTEHNPARLRGSRIERAFRLYNEFMTRWFLDPLCRVVYGPRYLIPIREQTGWDKAVMALRVSSLIGGTVAVWVLMFAGVL